MHWIWIVFIICILGLISGGFYHFLKEQEKQDNSMVHKVISKKNGVRYSVKRIVGQFWRYLCDKSFFSIITEILAVFIGAMLAVACTNAYDNWRDNEASIATSAVSSKDMYTQAQLLNLSIKQYQEGSIDIETLRLNAPIDVSLVEPVIYETYVMKTLEKGPYSMLLQVYRDIERINAYLESDRIATELYVLELCNNLVEDAEFLSELITWTMERYTKNIDEVQSAQWYEDFVLRFFEAKNTEPLLFE